jgi:hypothetical protein
MNLPKITIPESWRVLATGITSIHGWPIFQALQHNVLERGSYDPSLFRGMLRHEEKGGPPRIGDVSLNSAKLNQALNHILE